MTIRKYSKLKMFVFYCLSVLVNLTPLIVVLIINWRVCIKTTREGVALSVAGFVWIGFLIISMIGSLPHKMNRALKFTIVFVFLIIIQPLIENMVWFAGAVAIGAYLDWFIMQPIITRYKELRIASKTADLTTTQVKEAMREIMKEEGSGRV